jgi:hydrogenase maturation protease
MMRTLVLGMGNPILCDDAVGIRLARDFRKHLTSGAAGAAQAARGAEGTAPGAAGAAVPPAAGLATSPGGGGPAPGAIDVIEECSVGGLNLIDLAAGYDRLIVFDSIATPGGRPGTWYAMTGSSYRETMNLTNVHDANFTTALELGRRMGTPLPDPDGIHIFAVEIADNTTFSETMTPELEASYPHYSGEIMEEVMKLLDFVPVANARHDDSGMRTDDR